jgi:hypothetical protein
MNRIALLLGGAALWACGACNWVSLATHSLTYRTAQRGEAGNVAARGALVYATLAEAGIVVIDGTTGQTLATVAPPDSQSIDDLAIADGLLFALDARPPGHLSVYSLADPAKPRLLGVSREVAVGPFSGVSAMGGLCVVSGGTSQLTLWRYDSSGALTGPVATADLGRGQPDVLLSTGGVLYVSTHYWGPYFGLDVARFDAAHNRIELLAKLPLPRAGFTTGGAKPANFPIESALLGSDTLLVASARGLDVVDVHTPAQPRLITTIDLGGPAVNVDVDRQNAAVVVGGDTPALVYLDLAATSPLQHRVELPVGTIPTGVALGGPRAAVAAGSTGVVLFTK